MGFNDDALRYDRHYHDDYRDFRHCYGSHFLDANLDAVVGMNGRCGL
ncbi:hypothetical protein [Hafnia alvei]